MLKKLKWPWQKPSAPKEEIAPPPPSTPPPILTDSEESEATFIQMYNTFLKSLQHIDTMRTEYKNTSNSNFNLIKDIIDKIKKNDNIYNNLGYLTHFLSYGIVYGDNYYSNDESDSGDSISDDKINYDEYLHKFYKDEPTLRNYQANYKNFIQEIINIKKNKPNINSIIDQFIAIEIDNIYDLYKQQYDEQSKIKLYTEILKNIFTNAEKYAIFKQYGGIRKNIHKTSKNAKSKKPSKKLVKKSSKKSVKTSLKRSSKKPSKKSVKTSLKRSSKKPSKKSVKTSLKQSTKKASKKSIKTSLKQSTKKSLKKASKKPTKKRNTKK